MLAYPGGYSADCCFVIVGAASLLAGISELLEPQPATANVIAVNIGKRKAATFVDLLIVGNQRPV